jgi:acyl-CoA thioesterase-1
MKCRVLAAVLALALAACGDAPDSPAVEAPQTAAAARAPQQATSGPERRILAFGDSLFAGYGLDDGQGYPDVLQASLRARGINARVIDAGVSGDTTAAGRQRIEFVLDAQEAPPELALVELGGNDLLRGISPPRRAKTWPRSSPS